MYRYENSRVPVNSTSVIRISVKNIFAEAKYKLNNVVKADVKTVKTPSPSIIPISGITNKFAKSEMIESLWKYIKVNGSVPSWAEKETALKSNRYRNTLFLVIIFSLRIGYTIKIESTAENDNWNPGLNISAGFSRSKINAAMESAFTEL